MSRRPALELDWPKEKGRERGKVEQERPGQPDSQEGKYGDVLLGMQVVVVRTFVETKLPSGHIHFYWEPYNRRFW